LRRHETLDRSAGTNRKGRRASTCIGSTVRVRQRASNVLLVLLLLTAGAWRRTQPGTPGNRRARTSWDAEARSPSPHSADARLGARHFGDGIRPTSPVHEEHSTRICFENHY
jgi:hypothetical protein